MGIESPHEGTSTQYEFLLPELTDPLACALQAESLRARAAAGKVALEASKKAELQEAERVPLRSNLSSHCTRTSLCSAALAMP